MTRDQWESLTDLVEPLLDDPTLDVLVNGQHPETLPGRDWVSVVVTRTYADGTKESDQHLIQPDGSIC